MNVEFGEYEEVCMFINGILKTRILSSLSSTLQKVLPNTNPHNISMGYSLRRTITEATELIFEVDKNKGFNLVRVVNEVSN